MVLGGVLFILAFLVLVIFLFLGIVLFIFLFIFLAPPDPPPSFSAIRGTLDLYSGLLCVCVYKIEDYQKPKVWFELSLGIERHIVVV